MGGISVLCMTSSPPPPSCESLIGPLTQMFVYHSAILYIWHNEDREIMLYSARLVHMCTYL